MSVIEALYIFDEHNNLILSHTYISRPPPPSVLLPLYLQHASPRPSLIYLPSLNPPTLLYSVIQDNILFISPCSQDVEPLLVLEFLHRTADSLQEFLGSPLLASKITGNYDIVAQIVAEMADAGVPCQSEPNALRDVVETGPGVLNNLLGKVGIPGGAPAGIGGGPGGGPGGGLARTVLKPAETAQGSAIPWRRSNVRHTSNELYVDIVETLSVTLAPSGRPLSAFAYGSVAFTSKVSGVPDLLLNLSTGGKGAGMGNRGDQLRTVMERAVFHPCVRLNKWKQDGVLSFVPPDGKFVLCGYETDLLGPDAPLTTNQTSSNKLDLPATLEVNTGSGVSGNEFEVRLLQSAASASSFRSAAAASLQSNLSSATSRPGTFKAGSTGDSKCPTIEDIIVHVPLPSGVRNVSDLRPSRGEAQWSPVDGKVEWKVPAKDFGIGGATLRCTIQGPISDGDEEESAGVLNGMTATTYDYTDEEPSAYQSHSEKLAGSGGNSVNSLDDRRVEKNRELMPTAATLSFSIKGWLASGLKVESLLVDTKKSRGLGPEVKPYKGVKYLTVSRGGVEVRC
ncbi:clathrin adaptor, mu subunit [Teratosphaeria nubilosa]|uniref:Clathrin adaptor, mu subunit n=1 Tax=Teratosphaeria nubilosa TaxID=161662 RepID=A0A6G1LMJ1_9PEZI|nr:clathrin adaptor, mu subunit [Teratosphaeria nubilosa]